MKDKLLISLATFGVAAWSLLLAVRTQAFLLFYPSLLWGEKQTFLPANDLLPLLFLTATSWVGAWLTAYSIHFLALHRSEADTLAKLGVIQALLPVIAFPLPLAYLFFSRRGSEERLMRLTEVGQSSEE